MFMLPDLYTSNPDGPSVYVASSPIDSVRIHCFVSPDGEVTTVGLFVGPTLFRIENTKGF